MNMEDAEKILKLVSEDESLRVKIKCVPYLDGFAHITVLTEEDDLEDEDTVGDIVYSSEVMHRKPLSEVSTDDVRIYRDVTNELWR